MQQMTKTLPPPIKPPRVSVPVSDEVLVAFKRLAKAGNMSTGAAIAQWLADTVEAAQFLALKMEQAREAPKQVMREMHAYALGLADETGELMRTISAKGKAVPQGDAKARTGGAAVSKPPKPSKPPSCNTGGKVTGASKRKPAGEST